MPKNVFENLNKVYNELITLGATQSMMCCVPLAVDQCVFFRAARDSASTLLCPKPAVINAQFLPGLKQSATKMGTTSEDAKNSTIFLDMKPKEVEKTIKQHAHSGGRDTMREHRLYGGDLKKDRSYQYLTFFLESDEDLRKMAVAFTNGTMGSGDLKKITAELVAKEIETHQKNKELVTDEIVKHFFNCEKNMDIGGVYDRKSHNTTNDQYKDYDNYGINFDRLFGMKCKDETNH
jgi:tryptophanyl-tRNA synthetase